MTKGEPTVPGFYFYKQADLNMGQAIVTRVYKGRKDGLLYVQLLTGNPDDRTKHKRIEDCQGEWGERLPNWEL